MGTDIKRSGTFWDYEGVVLQTRVAEFCHVVRMIKTGLSKAKPLILLQSRSSGPKWPQSEKGLCVVGVYSLYPCCCCFPILWPWVISNI